MLLGVSAHALSKGVLNISIQTMRLVGMDSDGPILGHFPFPPMVTSFTKAGVVEQKKHG